jgi:hypothetical protein
MCLIMLAVWSVFDATDDDEHASGASAVVAHDDASRWKPQVELGSELAAAIQVVVGPWRGGQLRDTRDLTKRSALDSPSGCRRGVRPILASRGVR